MNIRSLLGEPSAASSGRLSDQGELWEQENYEDCRIELRSHNLVFPCIFLACLLVLGNQLSLISSVSARRLCW